MITKDLALERYGNDECPLCESQLRTTWYMHDDGFGKQHVKFCPECGFDDEYFDFDNVRMRG